MSCKSRNGRLRRPGPTLFRCRRTPVRWRQWCKTALEMAAADFSLRIFFIAGALPGLLDFHFVIGELRKNMRDRGFAGCQRDVLLFHAESLTHSFYLNECAAASIAAAAWFGVKGNVVAGTWLDRRSARDVRARKDAKVKLGKARVSVLLRRQRISGARTRSAMRWANCRSRKPSIWRLKLCRSRTTIFSSFAADDRCRDI